MFGRRYFVWDFHEMIHTPIILIALLIASAHIQNNFVVANEQQQAEQLGKKKQYTWFIQVTSESAIKSERNMSMNMNMNTMHVMDFHIYVL